MKLNFINQQDTFVKFPVIFLKIEVVYDLKYFLFFLFFLIVTSSPSFSFSHAKYSSVKIWNFLQKLIVIAGHLSSFIMILYGPAAERHQLNVKLSSSSHYTRPTWTPSVWVSQRQVSRVSPPSPAPREPSRSSRGPAQRSGSRWPPSEPEYSQSHSLRQDPFVRISPCGPGEIKHWFIPKGSY